jgi:anti-sigma-K factor RskA
MSGEDERHEDVAAYVLGALGEEEARAFAEHLRGCARCREELGELQPVVDALPSAVPQRTAPAELRGRLLATVRSEAELRGAGARAGRAAHRDGARPGAWARRPWRLATAGLALAAVVAAVAIALSGGGGAQTRVVQAQVSARGAQVSLHIDNERGQLRIAGMPQSPPGHIYEVWVEREGVAHPTDALFTVSSAGSASVGIPGSLAGASRVMVTAEPRGGSSRPTSAPVIVARVG